MHLDLPYHSRRDELGGVISDQDWTAFVRRLEGVIDKVKKKRRRIIKRRKKRGKKLMPRATLFKPPKKVKLDKNPLWREVFMQESSDEEDSGSDADDAEIFAMYRDTMAAKGIKSGKNATQRHLLTSAQSVPEKKTNDLKLPPIDGHKTGSKKMATKGRGPSPNKMKMSRIGSGLKYTNIGKEAPGITSNMKGLTPPLSRGESKNKKLRTAA